MTPTASGFYLNNDGGFVVSMHCLYMDDDGVSEDRSISKGFTFGKHKTEILDPKSNCPKLSLNALVKLKVVVNAGNDNIATENFIYDPNGPIQGYKISGSTLNNSLQYKGPR